MRLADLLADVPHVVRQGEAALPVHAVVADSRQVGPGDVFVCLPGYRTEGGETRADRHEFAAAALAAGAVALVVERPVEAGPHVCVVEVPDAWQALAAMACRWQGNPSLSLRMVGVTGTSGKTSTTYFIDSVLRAAGWTTARLGTIDYRIGDLVHPAHQTTPEAPELQRLLREAVDLDCEAAVMEVSSHALELRRVAGIAFDVAVFTNLGHDHLNFHPDLHHYRRAKGRLFEELGSGGKRATAVVNRDDPQAEYMLGVNRGEALTFGLDPGSDVRATECRSGLDGSSFLARTPAGEFPVAFPHLGEFHVHNALAAVGVGVALGLSPDTIAAGIAAAPPVPGRFELVDEGQPFRVAVDYAHKPEALERLLEGARRLGPRRLLTVFGCGGDRDRAKRPVMGRLAARGSDRVIVTSDNPRHEDPQAILEAIWKGVEEVPGGPERSVLEPDRNLAIRRAIREAEAGDLVLIAGKGHETYQILGHQWLDFDDRDVAGEALRERYGR